ncbi:MAG: glycosyltransferase family 39 protein, partial [Verrucomicrobiota bacterium]
MTKLFTKIATSRVQSFFLLLLVGTVLLLPGTRALPLMDRDEPKFAQATWEMMETQQFTIPYFNKSYRFDKPPLTYWWMRIHFALMGKTEFAARLHSVLASILTAFVIYLFGRFMFSPTAGLGSGLAWLTTLQIMIHSRLCVADMPMLLGVVISMYAIARLLFAENEPRKFGPYYWLLVFGLAFGFLAKGPIAWITPLFALILCRWPIGRQPLRWKRLQPFTAILIALGIVAIWGIPALRLTQGAYYDEGIGKHVVERGVSAFNGRVNIPIIYYLITGFASLLPWSAFFPSIVSFRRAELKADQKRAFLTAWFIAPFLIFACYATQLPHYIMPGFPGLVLLIFC